ncbi:hypothetical protein EV363DRAFT_1299992 [Boletus edulis]|nr:hypothetical protein EV363DRAFT_1299992 [Boletus edulis]
MASSCNVIGIIGVRNGHAFQYAPGKQFWKHDDVEVDVFTFGGGSSAPLDDGVYFGAARIVARMTAGADVQTTEPILQLFVNEGGDDVLPPVFVIVGKTSRTNFMVDQNQVFDIDISQYGAAPQQLIRLRCFYPNENSRFMKTPLPSVGKHVVIHGHLTGFSAGRCIIHIVDIALGPGTDVSGPSSDVPPSSKLGKFDWKGEKGKGKHARTEDDSKQEDDDQALASTSASGS